MATIKLRSSDGIIFETTMDVIQLFGVIKTMLDVCDNSLSANKVVPVPIVPSHVLAKILRWAEVHYTETLSKKCSKDCWKQIFSTVDQDTLFDVITAANFLDIRELLDMGCTNVANMLHGKTPEQIRDMFNITNDIKPNEKD